MELQINRVRINRARPVSVDGYLFRVVSGNRGSNENALYIITTGDVSFSKWVINDNHSVQFI